MDKSKFTANPQLDAEGFVMTPERAGPPSVTPRGWPPGTETWRDLSEDLPNIDPAVQMMVADHLLAFQEEPCPNHYSCLQGGECICAAMGFGG